MNPHKWNLINLNINQKQNTNYPIILTLYAKVQFCIVHPQWFIIIKKRHVTIWNWLKYHFLIFSQVRKNLQQENCNFKFWSLILYQNVKNRLIYKYIINFHIKCLMWCIKIIKNAIKEKFSIITICYINIYI